MKVLFLQNTLYSYRVDFFDMLSSRGIDVTVAHCDKYVEGIASFKQVLLNNKKFGPFYLTRGIPNLDQYDVVVSMFDLHWLSYIFPVLKPRKNKFLFWGHGLGKSGNGNKIRAWLCKCSDGVVLYNEQKKQAMINIGIEEKLLYVANNTILVKNAGFDRSTKRTKFLFVGRLQARKRVDIFIRAFARCFEQLQEGQEAEAVIIGDGDQAPILKSLANDLSVDKQCTFTGAISDNERLKPFFDHALAYVSPGPMGLGVNHAFAFGVPTLSNKAEPQGPETWLLDQSNSLWIDSTDENQQVEQLATQMQALIDNSEMSKALCQKAFQDYQEKCSMDVMVQGFIDAINTNN